MRMNATLSWQALLQQRISELFGAVPDLRFEAVGGGSINDTYQLSFSGHRLFCKINSATKFPHLFEKEKQGLEELSGPAIVKTPRVIDCFEKADYQFLLLEWIPEGPRTTTCWKTFGEQLANQHRLTQEMHGWKEANYMGSVPQPNTMHKDWCSFFAEQRLQPLIMKCAEKKLLTATQLAQFEALRNRLPEVFADEKPSLLHGDLWSGNFLCDASSQPVVIDPAVYFGHRSMDLAMTTLFGGFHQSFYEAYDYHFPLPGNHKEQWTLCNLYPLLVHLYLFGSGYLPQVLRTLQSFA